VLLDGLRHETTDVYQQWHSLHEKLMVNIDNHSMGLKNSIFCSKYARSNDAARDHFQQVGVGNCQRCARKTLENHWGQHCPLVRRERSSKKTKPPYIVVSRV
jgi:hypothetical protein